MKELNNIIDKFPGQNILVIGDIMLDEYIFGDVSRINPEAPVPILNANKKEYRLGGAANVANNIISLGGKCTLIGQVGKDPEKETLIQELNNKNIRYFLLENSKFQTIKKTRIIARGQQTIRVDWENLEPITFDHVNKIKNYIIENNFDLIVISDYNKGVIIPPLVEEIKKLNIKINQTQNNKKRDRKSVV